MLNVTESELRAAFQPYMHSLWKVVGLKPSVNEGVSDYSCDNYHLFTALYFRVLRSYGFKPTRDELDRYALFVAACQVQPGLYSRFQNE